MTRVAINGLGRIGRAAVKQIIDDGALELAAVNDLVPAEELAYLLKHDSVYGRYGRDVRAQSGRLVVNGQSCVALSEKNLDKLPWRDLASTLSWSAPAYSHMKPTSRVTSGRAPSSSSSPRRSGEATMFRPSSMASTPAPAGRASSHAPAARRTASHQ
jgi:glyceraldehyde 3-phosphate dehydrogenase-like protein